MPDNLPATTQDEAFVTFVERAMRDPSFDVIKFEALLDRYERMQMREAKRVFNDTMADIQAELDIVTKDRANPAIRSRYATLEALYREAMPVVSKHRVKLTWGTETPPQPSWMRVTCTLSRGHYSETHYLDGPIMTGEGSRGGRTQMTEIQAIGGTVTYLRRYLLMMVLNLVQGDDPVDDDGNGGHAQLPPPQQQASQAKPQAKSKAPDPLPGESLTDYSKRIEAALKGNGEPPPIESKPNGLTVEEKRSQNWIRMVFQARCNAVQDKDAAGALLRDEELQAAEMRLKEKSPQLWVEFDAVRQAMITRIWPPGEGEKTNGGAQ